MNKKFQINLKFFKNYSKLAKIAYESLSNAFRLHYDSLILYQNRSYSTAFVLSVLALEEFGKFLIYNDLAWNEGVGQGGIPNDYVELHKQYIKESLGDHNRKIDKVLYNYFGPFIKKGRDKYLKSLSRERLTALYVGVNQKNGHINLPKKFPKNKVMFQLKLMNNEIFLKSSSGVKTHYLTYDNDANDNLLKRNYQKLAKISKKLKGL